MKNSVSHTFLVLLCLGLLFSCGERTEKSAAAEQSPEKSLPSILLITMDTTRADAMGYEKAHGQTPFLDQMAKQSLVFLNAYATVPMTLPSHTSMFTGRYPSDHGVHENARYLDPNMELLAERLKAKGYGTAAFIAAYPLSKQFGLSRGFDVYNQDFEGGASERNAAEVNREVLEYLSTASTGKPAFLWVHYFDPHAPYHPPEPFHTQFKDDPYLGEVAFMDLQIGILVERFKAIEGQRNREPYVMVLGDHGEGLGDHGEALHGHLIFNSTMRVPLMVDGPGIQAEESKNAVSVRQVFHTISSWAGYETVDSLLDDSKLKPVFGEAMKPYLQYGWQPQKMMVLGSKKLIHAGEYLLFDLEKDPEELNNLIRNQEAIGEFIPEQWVEWLNGYPLPGLRPADTSTLSPEELEQLASLGYVSSDLATVPLQDGPIPHRSLNFLEDLDEASSFFVTADYDRAIEKFEEILVADPKNFMVCLRLAASHSLMGRETQAMSYFEKAVKIRGDSMDLRHYLAMHYLRFEQAEKAEPLLEEVLESSPHRLTTLQALAGIKERRGDALSSRQLFERIWGLNQSDPSVALKLGALCMMDRQSERAVRYLEAARDLQRDGFKHGLDLAVCYMDLKRFEEAREVLDQEINRQGPADSSFAMVLFKRAQIASLLHEPDLQARIEEARTYANSRTRVLIERERLFQ